MIPDKKTVEIPSINSDEDLLNLVRKMMTAESMDQLPEVANTCIGDPSADFGVVLFHGFAGGNLELFYIGHKLAQAGCRVYIPLLPGHGTNSDDLVKYGSEDWIKYAIQVIKAMYNENPSRKVIIGGHSLGGSLALAVERIFPNICGIILLATPFRYSLFSRIALKLLKRTNLKMKFDEFSFSNEELYQHPYVDFLSKAYSAIFYKSAYEAFNLMDKALMTLGSCDLPVLMIYSKQDHRVPKSHGPKFNKILKSDLNEFVWLNNSDHVIVFDTEKEIVVEKVKNFINRVFEI